MRDYYDEQITKAHTIAIRGLEARVKKLESKCDSLKCCGNCIIYFNTMHTDAVKIPDLFCCPVVRRLKYPMEKCEQWEQQCL